MTDQGYLVLRAMIDLARSKQIRCLSTLKRLMVQHGYQQEHIDEAVEQWAKYERAKRL